MSLEALQARSFFCERRDCFEFREFGGVWGLWGRFAGVWGWGLGGVWGGGGVRGGVWGGFRGVWGGLRGGRCALRTAVALHRPRLSVLVAASVLTRAVSCRVRVFQSVFFFAQ